MFPFGLTGSPLMSLPPLTADLRVRGSAAASISRPYSRVGGLNFLFAFSFFFWFVFNSGVFSPHWLVFYFSSFQTEKGVRVSST
jgi:hypothetical protein